MNDRERRVAEIFPQLLATMPLALLGSAAAKMAVIFDESLSRMVGLVVASRDQVHAWRDAILEDLDRGA